MVRRMGLGVVDRFVGEAVRAGLLSTRSGLGDDFFPSSYRLAHIFDPLEAPNVEQLALDLGVAARALQDLDRVCHPDVVDE